MEENKQSEEVKVEKEKKTVAKKTTAKKATAKTSTAKKTPAKKTTTKKTTITAKTGTKKATTKKVVEPKNEEKKEEIKKEEIKVAEETNIEQTTQEEWKKVETRQPETKISEKKPKKKHRILKTIFMLIIILLILFLVHTFKNYMIISDLVEKQETIYGKENNYSFVTENYSSYDTNDRNKIEHYYKEGKNIMVVRDTGIIWSDEKAKEVIIMSPKDLKATVTNSENILRASLPSLQGEDDFAKRLCFIYLITSDEVNGKECYKIIWGEAITWVEKETGLIVKSMNGKRIIDGEEYDSITEWKDYKFNKLTEQDVSRPNLLGYEVTIQE